jgi:hypothetical protein
MYVKRVKESSVLRKIIGEFAADHRECWALRVKVLFGGQWLGLSVTRKQFEAQEELEHVDDSYADSLHDSVPELQIDTEMEDESFFFEPLEADDERFNTYNVAARLEGMGTQPVFHQTRGCNSAEWTAGLSVYSLEEWLLDLLTRFSLVFDALQSQAISRTSLGELKDKVRNFQGAHRRRFWQVLRFESLIDVPPDSPLKQFVSVFSVNFRSTHKGVSMFIFASDMDEPDTLASLRRKESKLRRRFPRSLFGLNTWDMWTALVSLIQKTLEKACEKDSAVRFTLETRWGRTFLPGYLCLKRETPLHEHFAYQLAGRRSDPYRETRKRLDTNNSGLVIEQ